MASVQNTYALKDTKSLSKELSITQKKIKDFENKINKDQSEVNEQYKLLKQIEKTISLHQKNIFLLEQDIKKKHSEIISAQNKISKLTSKVDENKNILSLNLRQQLYNINSSNFIKGIINKQSNHKKNSYLYWRWQQEQIKNIKKIIGELEYLDILTHELSESINKQKQKQEQLKTQININKKLEVQRTRLLDTNKKLLTDNSIALSRLTENETNLKRQLRLSSRSGRTNQNHSKFKRSLTPPIRLSPSTSLLKPPIIKVKAGTPVYAIAEGKVVFSNWLKGFGLLLIIDHGNGYMSLYGHNQTLLKDVHSSVKQGEVISLAGSSGGISQASLFFEIRKNGQQIADIDKWFKL